MEEFVIPGDILGTFKIPLPLDNVFFDFDLTFSSKCGIIKRELDESVTPVTFNLTRNFQNDFLKHYDSISIGSLVICKIKSLTENQCKVDIICTRGKALAAVYKGTIYIEHIRSSFHKDFTKTYHSFQLGDIVLARVIGVFNNRNSRERVIFLLSTAEIELGVILAKSPNDPVSFLIPTSWREMVCPATHQKFKRKVAKVRIHKD